MKRHHLFHLALWLVILLSFALSYGIVQVIFHKFEALPSFWVYMINVTVTVLVFSASTNLCMRMFGQGSEMEVFRQTFAAFERISRGDFDIRLTDHSGRFEELVERINKMAKELGSREALRQEFISNVSHEFQSPLTSLIGYATLLQQEPLSREAQSYVEIIQWESHRLSKLSDNLLYLSALEIQEAMERENFSLSVQIERVLLLLEPKWLEKNIRLKLDLPKTDFCGNEGLLSQVWVNLLANAIKFTPPDGEIQVRIHQEGSAVNCEIRDTGIGIDPVDLPRIFERFYKADKSRTRADGGNGLGLAISKKIVELHGGTISVQSKLGEGTTFLVRLNSVYKAAI